MSKIEPFQMDGQCYIMALGIAANLLVVTNVRLLEVVAAAHHNHQLKVSNVLA